jgi:hypothetical protein
VAVARGWQIRGRMAVLLRGGSVTVEVEIALKIKQLDSGLRSEKLCLSTSERSAAHR